MRTLSTPLFVLCGALLIGVAACRPPMPSSFPDDGGVKKAQKSWCAMLGKAESPKGNWRYTQACEAAEPTSSAAFLTRLTSCFEGEYAQLGDQVPDEAVLMDVCTNDVIAKSNPGPAKITTLVKSRCRRIERCTPITYAQCIESYTDLDPSYRLIRTSMYNLRAQFVIARCLDDGECSKDEDAAMEACYEPLTARRAWFTTMLGRDEAVRLATD